LRTQNNCFIIIDGMAEKQLIAGRSSGRKYETL